MKDRDHNGLDWERLAQQANYRVETLAKVARRSRRSLHRHFVNQFGLPPREWLDFLRLNRAKALLLERLPVKAVASQVGFRQENNFYPFFRRLTGQTPSEFLADFERSAVPSHRVAAAFLPGNLGCNWSPDHLLHASRFTDSAQLCSERSTADADWDWAFAFEGPAPSDSAHGHSLPDALHEPSPVEPGCSQWSRADQWLRE